MTAASFHVATEVVTCFGVGIKREIFNKFKILLMYWYLPSARLVFYPTNLVIDNTEMWIRVIQNNIFWFQAAQFIHSEAVVPEP